MTALPAGWTGLGYNIRPKGKTFFFPVQNIKKKYRNFVSPSDAKLYHKMNYNKL